MLNVDMIGYDGNDDGRIDLDVRDIADSYQIRNDLININSYLELDLVPFVVDPGTLASDHSAFWNTGYSALLLGEGWSQNDHKPKYHTEEDRIELFNLDYFYNCVQLVVGYSVSKAVINDPNAVSTDLTDLTDPKTTIYPIPTDNKITIKSSNIKTIKLYHLNGTYTEYAPKNDQTTTLDLSDKEKGSYIIEVLYLDGKTERQKVIKN